MVVCKFFLQGNCHFGNTCKNEHTYNENTSSVLVKKPEVDITVLVKAVAGDMLKAEKGSQWPFTCYGPYQAKPCFPGFEDKSYEEIRLGYYEAKQNGTIEQYKQQLSILLQEIQLKMKALQNPSPEATNILRNIYYNTETSSNFANANNSLFGNKPPSYSNSIFGNASNQQAPTFSSTAPASNSVFGNAIGTYPSSNSVFGNTNTQNFSSTTSNSIFAKSATSNVFGGPAPTQNIFGSNPTNQSVFSGATSPNSFGTSNNQNIFASAVTNQNAFSNVPKGQSVFASTAPVQNVFTSVANQNVFNSAPSQNVFASTAPNQNIFTNTASNPSIFASTASVLPNVPPNQNIFTSIATTPNAFAVTSTNSASIFGGPQQPQSFGNQPVFPNALSQNSTGNMQSIFGSNQTSTASVFSNQNSLPFSSPFASNNSGNMFQQPKNDIGQPQNSVFGNQHSNSIFGNVANQVVTATIKREDDPAIYSKLSDLTSNDIAQFESQCFEFGKVPVRPPPLEMC